VSLYHKDKISAAIRRHVAMQPRSCSKQHQQHGSSALLGAVNPISKKRLRASWRRSWKMEVLAGQPRPVTRSPGTMFGLSDFIPRVRARLLFSEVAAKKVHQNSASTTQDGLTLKPLPDAVILARLTHQRTPLLLIAKLPETDGVRGVAASTSGGLRVITSDDRTLRCALPRLRNAVSSMRLTDEQLSAIIAWAERTPELRVVVLYKVDSMGEQILPAMWSLRS
jgi:hypothetical protein